MHYLTYIPSLFNSICLTDTSLKSSKVRHIVAQFNPWKDDYSYDFGGGGDL